MFQNEIARVDIILPHANVEMLDVFRTYTLLERTSPESGLLYLSPEMGDHKETPSSRDAARSSLG